MVTANLWLDDLLLPLTDLMLLVNTQNLVIFGIFWPHVPLDLTTWSFWAILDIFWPYDHWSDQPLAWRWRPPASSNWSDVASLLQGQDFVVCPRHLFKLFWIEVKFICSWIRIQLCSIDGPLPRQFMANILNWIECTVSKKSVSRKNFFWPEALTVNQKIQIIQKNVCCLFNCSGSIIFIPHLLCQFMGWTPPWWVP